MLLSAHVRIALAQFNPHVGDLEGNAARIESWAWAAADEGAQLVVFPEQAIIGYPAEDLLLKPHVLEQSMQLIESLAKQLPIPAVIGAPELAQGTTFNSAAILAGGKVAGWYRKRHLPNYGVFDEHRWFRSGTTPVIIEIGGVACGLTICEDLWVDAGLVHEQAVAGAHVILNLSASPWRLDRGSDREKLLEAHATRSTVAIALCNQVGGQDELAFDGRSLVVDQTGRLIARGAHGSEQLVICDIDAGAVEHQRQSESDALTAGLQFDERAPARPISRLDLDKLVNAWTPPQASPGDNSDRADGTQASSPGIQIRCNTVEPVPQSEVAECWAMLVMALADYVAKNGFSRVVLGMSGGIDSALVMALAVDALGASRVRAVTMPSRVTGSETLGDAITMSGALGVELVELAIEPIMDSYLDLLAPVFVGKRADTTEENLQARIRGNLLMAISNKFGDLVLTTGNKSEVSVGYSTLYGDAAGGFAPIKDVPKLLVWQLSRWRNEQAAAAGEAPMITPSIIERPPTAELREGQKDTDSLPPYDVLDPMLEAIVEHDRSASQLVAEGYDPALVERICLLIDRAEYKRRQAPPGIRVTSRAFGRERRMPITNGYRERVHRQELSVQASIATADKIIPAQ